MLHRAISLLLVISCIQPLTLKGEESVSLSPQSQLLQENEYEYSSNAYPKLQPSIYTKIAQELPTSFDEYKPSPLQPPVDEDRNDQLTDGQKRSIILKLFSEYSLANFQSSAPSISTDDIRRDLEFFNQASLYKHVKRTATVFGDVVLARRLAEPTADIRELHRRQNIVKKLLDDEQLFKTLDAALTEVKKAEPVMLSFFSQQNELRQQSLHSLYFDRTLWGGFPGSEEWDKNEKLLLATEILQKGWLLWGLAMFSSRTQIALEKINPYMLGTTWGAVSLLRFKPDLFQKIAGPALLAGLIGWLIMKKDAFSEKSLPSTFVRLFPFLGAAAQRSAPATPAMPGMPPTSPSVPLSQPSSDYKIPLINLCVRAVIGLKLFLTGLAAPVKQKFEQFTELQRTLSTFEMAALLPLALYNEVKVIYVWQQGIAYLQKRFMKLAASVRKMRSVSASLFQHKELMGMIPEALPLIHLFQHGDGSEDMQKLLAMLESPTFKGDVSIRSHFGRIAATNKLMNATKYDWVEIFEALGHLDVYLSTAKLLKEFKTKKVSYAFAQYVTADTPKLSLVQFWDPLLDVELAVPNTITLGDPTCNILLTGPNTGGKSTIIKGIMLATLCAQTLGIVPAQACVMTPFSAFNTYSRVEDDIEHELSLFAAEVRRANHLKKKIVNLPYHAFGLTIIDEMFRGTAPDNAEQLSYQYAVDFGNCPNSMCLMATHYPKLIDLEKATQEKYHNYKVEIEKLPDGKLKRTYKLVRGFTTQNVALDILKEQGLIA